jgi:hypothetical protein
MRPTLRSGDYPCIDRSAGNSTDNINAQTPPSPEDRHETTTRQTQDEDGEQYHAGDLCDTAEKPSLAWPGAAIMTLGRAVMNIFLHAAGTNLH